MDDVDDRPAHCDPRVVHAPEDDCKYCNERPSHQRARVRDGIAFTGHPPKPGQEPCPADAARGLGQAHRWQGNVPWTPEIEAEYQRNLDELKKYMDDYLGRSFNPDGDPDGCPRCGGPVSFRGTALTCPKCGVVGGF